MARPTLRPSKAPNLIVARPQYDQQQQELFKNQLRLYFTEVDNLASALLGPNGGDYLEFSNIAASDSTNQYAAGNDTPTVVAWDTLDSASGWTLNAPGSATALVSGVYKITYSAQVANTANAVHDAVFWLKVDSGSGFVDVPNSATFFSVPARKSAGVPSYICAYSEVTFTVNGGDVIELWWATDLAYNPVGPVNGVYLHAEAAQTIPYAHPAVPSVVGSITFVSRLPT